MYDLYDELRFGEGITIEEASVVSAEPVGVALLADWDGVDQHLIVEDQPIESGAQHVLLVTVVASVASAISADAGDCDLEDGETGTAYLNTAWLDVGEAVASDRACQAVLGSDLPDRSLERPEEIPFVPTGWVMLVATALAATRRARLQEKVSDAGYASSLRRG